MRRVEPRGEVFKAYNTTLSDIEINTTGEYYWCDINWKLNELLERYRGKMQLVYMDPPFVTGQTFQFKQRFGEKGWRGDKQYVITHKAYNDKWGQGKEDFFSMMERVLNTVHQLLSPEGSLYLHIDYRTSAYLRVMLDDIFGEENFVNEIIWYYQSGGRARRHFSRKHDTILFYRKSSRYYFNLEATGKPRGKESKNHMKREVDDDGRVFWSIKSGGRIYRYYEDTKVYPSDVWDDISHLQQRDPERTGYDTQKPEALLERIIKASSRPGDIVADFFAGSGTTPVVAQRLGRNWIAVDQSPFSLNVCRKRLLDGVANGRVTFIYQKEGNLDYAQPDIKVKLDQSNNGEATISIDRYELPAAVEIEEQSVTPRGLELVDYWAVGYLDDELFHIYDYASRSIKSPSIVKSLTIPGDPVRRPVAHIVDVLGNHNFFELW